MVTRSWIELAEDSANWVFALAGLSIEAEGNKKRIDILNAEMIEISNCLIAVEEQMTGECRVCARQGKTAMRDQSTQTEQMNCWSCHPEKYRYKPNFNTTVGRATAIRHYLGQTELCSQSDLLSNRKNKMPMFAEPKSRESTG